MADYPPFMNAYGQVTKVLEKIKEASAPDRFTLDFLATRLGFKSASIKPFVPLAKRLGLLALDGSPTDLYNSFRNPSQSGAALATAMKKGYGEIFACNEYANNLNHKDLGGLVMQITGLKKDHQAVRGIVGTFEALKSIADFSSGIEKPEVKVEEEKTPRTDLMITHKSFEEVGVNLSYTINLVLPRTNDISIFNAIFKSIRENLLKR